MRICIVVMERGSGIKTNGISFNRRNSVEESSDSPVGEERWKPWVAKARAYSSSPAMHFVNIHINLCHPIRNRTRTGIARPLYNYFLQLQPYIFIVLYFSPRFLTGQVFSKRIV